MKNALPKVLFYMKENRLVFKGGPLAVGYCYYQEMKRRGDDTISFLPSDIVKDSQPNNGITTDQETRVIKLLRTIKSYLWYSFKYFKAKPKHNLFDGFDIVHFHSTQELFLERDNLKNFSGRVILQSHSPMPLGEELYDLIELKHKKLIPGLKRNFRRMDKFAFLRADYIVFPCEDAEEPYYNRWKEYSLIHEQKKSSYRYVVTGIPLVAAKRERAEIIKELNLRDSTFLISYAGRHNEAKGYDLLKELGEEYLELDANSAIVVAGKEYPITRLKHPRWIELGWTDDARSYIAASDVFVLPNRETYFDLVMIEVLSLGTIVVASRTGGNKYFEKNGCPGVFLYDNKQECIELLKRINKMSDGERRILGEKNYEFYKNHLSVETMYNKYFEMLTTLG